MKRDGRHLWAFLVIWAGICVVGPIAALPERQCSTSVTLRASTVGDEQCTYTDSSAGNTPDCRLLSDYLEQYNSLVENDDCLQVRLSPGYYLLDSSRTTNITYSLVLEGSATVSCQSVDQTLASPLWFQRYTPFSSHPPTTTPTAADGEFFVQIEEVTFQNCQMPMRFDALDYVGISNCIFTGFTASAVDIFNCQRVLIDHSVFHNNTAMVEKDQYHANSGGVGIAYHTNDTVYFDPSLTPWVTVTSCEFTSNRALLPMDESRQQINQALNNQIYFGRGGGLGVFLDEYFINITVTVEKCSFDSNNAESFGGGLYLYIDGADTHHEFVVTESNFTANTAEGESFGGGVQVALLIRNANSDPSQLDFTKCSFIGNTASFGGGLSAVQVFSQGSGNKIRLRDSYFEQNTAFDVGSGVMFASLLYVQNRKSSYNYEVSDNIFFKNVSPGGTFAVGFIPQNFTGHNQFLNNTGPGLRSVGSQIAVKGNLSFIGNNAEIHEGGALYLSAFGQVKLYRGSHIDFVENLGRIGSAIVVDVQRTSRVFSQLIFNTQCFLIFEDTDVAPDSWDEVTLTFSGNRAAVAPVVYTSHLDLCSWFSVSNVANHIVSTFSTSNFTNWPVFDYSTGDNNATSHAGGTSSTFYFQTQALRVTTGMSTDESEGVFPGQKLQLSLKGLDQFNLSTYIIARISDSRANINQGAFSQSTDSELLANNKNKRGDYAVMFEPSLAPVTPNDPPVEVVYHTPVSTDWTNAKITAIVDTPYNVIDSKQLTLRLNVSICLPGHELQPREDGLLTCACQESTFSLLDCDETRNIIYLRNGLWATADDGSELQTHICPIPYCQCSDVNNITCDSLYYHNDPDTNKQCHTLREGTLCGRCVNDSSVGVLRFNCRECHANAYWTFGFLVIGDALVCVVILITLVKLRYTFPHSMKGLLFYIQTVYYTTEYFPASFWSARQYMLYLGSALGLYYPWDICLSPGTSALASFPPRFVPSLIALLVTVAAVITVFYCFEKRAQKRIWHGVWALILLLYAPLVYTCVSLLHCPSLSPAQGGDPSPRWFLDGEVACFKDGGHATLAILAIITLSLLGLLPLVIYLFFVFVHHSPFLKERYSIIERLSKAVKAGYTERTRWWGAWDLLRRLMLIAVVVGTPGRSVSALYVVVPALALHLYWWPYQKWWQNILETLILIIYCMLHLLGSTQAILDNLSRYSGAATPESQGKGLVVVEGDRLTVLLSFWLYCPLVMAATAAMVLASRALTVLFREKRKRGRFDNTSKVLDEDSDYYMHYRDKKTAKVSSTDVSIF